MAKGKRGNGHGVSSEKLSILDRAVRLNAEHIFPSAAFVLTVSFTWGGKRETGMQKGDLVIADDPESESRALTRFYGIILDITKRGSVSIELADGSVITRQRNSIAIYVHPPSNWKELFKRQEVLFQQPRQSLFTRNKKTYRHHDH